jgi:succinate dehydrogenase / fumarate reductase cytochrome b subunit
MTWKRVFTSSVGRKIVMSLTGIFLIIFLIVHVGINACIFNTLFDQNDHGSTFNRAAYFMGSTFLIRVMEIGLFALFFIHIIQGLMLASYNSTKRGTPYQVKYGNRGSRWYSRSMGLLGTLILLFLIVHIAQFWVPSRFGQLEEVKVNNGSEVVHNLFLRMQQVFAYPWVVILYVLGCISLGYHLAHGFQSSFRTLGVHNRKYVRMLVILGNWFSIIITIGFISMPISMYFGWVHQ